ncbi:hypothetical protein SMICM304S_00353 [Streptomyces microflavus]
MRSSTPSAKTSAGHTRRELRDAATAFERASRSHVRAVRGHDRALRQAARDLVRGGPALGRGEDGATTAMAIDMLFFADLRSRVPGHWHRTETAPTSPQQGRPPPAPTVGR